MCIYIDNYFYYYVINKAVLMCVCGRVGNHGEIHLLRILTKCGRNFCLFGVCFLCFALLFVCFICSKVVG